MHILRMIVWSFMSTKGILIEKMKAAKKISPMRIVLILVLIWYFEATRSAPVGCDPGPFIIGFFSINIPLVDIYDHTIMRSMHIQASVALL